MHEPKQPLSSWSYALIAMFGLVIAIGLLIFYVDKVPRLIETGSNNQVFYLLLIPWGLASAAFLFGTMRSVAILKSRQIPTTLELGGPVVVALLVVVGGFRLVPHAETFELTMRAHAADGTEPRIRGGGVVLEYGNRSDRQDIGSNGEANFKEIPHRFWGGRARALPEIDGYDRTPQEVRLDSEVIDLALVRERPLSSFRGTVVPPPGLGQAVVLRVDGDLGEGTADSLGRFNFTVKGREGDRVRLKIYVNLHLVYDDFQVLPGPVTLPISRHR
jgi:hypothetical protein